MRKLFDAMDKDYDGHLQKQEVVEGLVRMGMDKTTAFQEANRIFTVADVDENGYLEFDEWCTATMDKRKMLKKPRLMAAFKMLDKDNSGSISYDEVRDILIGDTTGTNEEVFQAMVQEMDIDGDGNISYPEFEKMMMLLVNKTSNRT